MIAYSQRKLLEACESIGSPGGIRPLPSKQSCSLIGRKGTSYFPPCLVCRGTHRSPFNLIAAVSLNPGRGGTLFLSLSLCLSVVCLSLSAFVSIVLFYFIQFVFLEPLPPMLKFRNYYYCACACARAHKSEASVCMCHSV